MNTDRKRIIVILGSGRSGTSVITRGLQVCGVSLGDNLMPPELGVNDKGFWEDQDIYALNMEIYKAINHDWSNLTSVPFDEMSEKAAYNFKLRASELLQQKLSSTRCFGFKDPQLTRLLPFWMEVFSSLDIDVNYVIACRNPVNVAQSMTRYTGFDLEKSYLLWFEHTLSSLQETLNQCRIVVDYDLLLNDPVNQLERLAKALDLSFDADEAIEFKSQFLEKSLRHNNYSKQDLELDRFVSPSVQLLYKLLLSYANDSVLLDDPVAASKVTKLSKQHQDNKLLLQYIQDKIEIVSEYDDQVSAFNQAIKGRDEQIESLVQIIAGLNKQITNFDQAVRNRDEFITNMVTAHDDQVSAFNQAMAERDKILSSRTELLKTFISPKKRSG